MKIDLHKFLNSFLKQGYIIALVIVFVFAVGTSFAEGSPDIKLTLISLFNKINTSLLVLSISLVYIINNYFDVLKKLGYNPITLVISCILPSVTTVVFLIIGVTYLRLSNITGELIYTNALMLYYIGSTLGVFIVLFFIGHVIVTIQKTSEKIDITLKK